MAESQQMAQEEAELQRAIAASKATAPPPRPQPPMIRQQTSGEELRRALALSREMATNRAQRSAVTSHMDDLERAIANSKQHWSPPTTWAKGVGTAFECLQIVGGDGGGNVWTPIVHPDIIDQLGRLCACNPVSEVEYSVDGVRHKTTMRDDGMLMQKEMDSSRQTLLRLVPFFFEYREDDGSWCPIQEPEAITALTAVLATSKNHVYKCQTKDHGPQMYEASLVNEQGLMLQSNIATDNPPRQLRATPVGPDGQPHFEFLEAEVNWKPGLSNWSAVPREINAMLAACAAGFGDAHFVINGATYTATRGLDGFVDQTNMLTGVKRPIRPAPWLGHGNARVVDATDGWVPSAEIVGLELGELSPMRAPMQPATPPVVEGVVEATIVEEEVHVGIVMPPPVYEPAATFYQPQQVIMGSVAEPVNIMYAQPVPAAAAYYYNPGADVANPYPYVQVMPATAMAAPGGMAMSPPLVQSLPVV